MVQRLLEKIWNFSDDFELFVIHENYGCAAAVTNAKYMKLRVV